VKLLLDTHAVLWWLEANSKLGRNAAHEISDPANQCWLSAVSVFEIETKHRLGKLSLPTTLQLGWDSTLAAEAWQLLPIDLRHARQAGRLPGPHRDPFDRLLAAQSEIENLILVSCDPAFAAFGTRTLW